MKLPKNVKPTRVFLYSPGFVQWSSDGVKALPAMPSKLADFPAFVAKVEAVVKSELKILGKDESGCTTLDLEIVGSGHFVRLNGQGWSVTYGTKK